MTMRTERDALGEIEVPSEALYGAQTARAITNFAISGYRMPRSLIEALATIKSVAAEVGAVDGSLPEPRAQRIMQAADEVARGDHDEQMLVDVFQTGSGTSWNMNVNEVIARRATLLGDATEVPIHPNDEVNRCQSSNDVVPAAIRLAARDQLRRQVVPACDRLHDALAAQAQRHRRTVKIGRTHLMDAMPVTYGQVFDQWCERVANARQQFLHAAEGLQPLPLGGTAVGSGVNAPADFGRRCGELLGQRYAMPVTAAPRPGTLQAGSDGPLACSAAMRQCALVVLRLADDIRWLASGPRHGLGEIDLPARQPGSSIMPDKVNPVTEEAVIQVGLQVVAHDQAIAQGSCFGSFELHLMQPLIAHNLLEGLRLLSQATGRLAVDSIAVLAIDPERLRAGLADHPILATALAVHIGHEQAVDLARQARETGRSIIDLAEAATDLGRERLCQILDPLRLADRAAEWVGR